METTMTTKQLQDTAKGIRAQCRAEYPHCLDEAIHDMCEAVIFAEGLKAREARQLREFCGL